MNNNQVLSPSKTLLAPEQWVAERSQAAILALRDCVEFDQRKLGGVPVFKGTRFSVSQLLTELADGGTIEEIAENFEVDAEALSKFVHALAVYLNKPLP